MYAELVYLTIDPKLAPRAAAAFSSDILPKVRSVSGFIAGHWVDPVDAQGFGFLLVETEKQAIEATPPNANWSAPGVAFKRTEVRRVAVPLP